MTDGYPDSQYLSLRLMPGLTLAGRVRGVVKGWDGRGERGGGGRGRQCVVTSGF